MLADCRADWRALPDDVRARVHLASIPMDDVDENANIVNAVQRHAGWWCRRAWSRGSG